MVGQRIITAVPILTFNKKRTIAAISQDMGWQPKLERGYKEEHAGYDG